MKHFMVFLSKKTGFLFVMASKPSIHWMSIKHHHSHEKRKEPLSFEQCVCAPAAWKKKKIWVKRFQTSLFVLMSVCLRRAPWKRSVGSCWTAKGASSGEVRPRLLSVVVPEAVNTRGSTRQDRQEQADKTGGTLLSCLLSTRSSGNGPRFLACSRANTPQPTRAWDGASRLLYEMDCHSTPTSFFLFTSHSKHFLWGFFFFFPREN